MPSLSEVIENFIEFCSSLSPVQLWFVLALAFLLLLYLAYRTMGLGGLFGVLLIGFFAYVLFDHDTLQNYNDKEKREADRMEQLESELRKNDQLDS